jgi:hypothetical protein
MAALRKFLTFFAFTVAATAAAETEQSTSSILDQYRTICKDDYNGELRVSEDAIYNLLAGRDSIETVVVIDTSGLMCGQRPIGLCGSGGCEVNLLVDGTIYTERGWSPINIQFNGHYLILIPLSGGMCGDVSNRSPCFKVLAWDELERKLLSPN